MGTILQFRQPDQSEQTAADVQAALKGSARESAEIIIFPGVRIARQDEPETPDITSGPCKRAKKAARRKV
jgi:hypothetical protein